MADDYFYLSPEDSNRLMFTALSTYLPLEGMFNTLRLTDVQRVVACEAAIVILAHKWRAKREDVIIQLNNVWDYLDSIREEVNEDERQHGAEIARKALEKIDGD